MHYILTLLLLWPLSSRAMTRSQYDDGYSVKIVSNDIHSVQLIDSNRLALKNRLELIEKAQNSIVFETYYFLPDEGGQVLLKALVEKKRQCPGVRISVLFDSWASNGLSGDDVHYLNQNGIEVRWFVGSNLFALGPQRHDHRKTWIFDNHTALIGGFNQASEHMGFSPLYNMVDREVRLEGPMVPSIKDSFFKIWNSASVTLPEGLSLDSHVNEIRSISLANIRETVSKTLARFPVVKLNHLSYFSDIQKQTTFSPFLKLEVDDLFLSAKKRIFIESRFFIPTTSTLMALFQKIRQGIQVHVLTNSPQSILPLENHFLNLARFFVAQVRLLGADIKYFSGGLKDSEQALNAGSLKAAWGTHSKTYVVDDQTLIGSYNLDPASDYLNLEHFLVLDSQELADQAAQSIRHNALN